MPMEGIEPTRPCGHWILSPTSLADFQPLTNDTVKGMTKIERHYKSTAGHNRLDKHCTFWK